MTGTRPPPLLLGATLVFWGWQTGFLGAGAILGLIIELPHWSKTRWDLTQEEFNRIWTFCTLLLLASAVYAFTLNEGPSRFSELLQDPDLRNQSRAGTSSARTAAALVRWLPMIFFLFVAAQNYSARGGVPLETVSLILRRRWKRAKKLGLPAPPSRSIDISYIYFILCLFASTIFTETSDWFFWGAAILIAWSLWPFRSPRFHPVIWAGTLAASVGLAFLGHRSVGELQHYLENLNPQWLSSVNRGKTDPGQSKTSLGQIGRLKLSPQIVIRVEGKQGPVPQLLREASYNTFKGHTWYSKAGRHEFERVDEEPPGSAFSLVFGKTNLASVTISCYLPGRSGLLPLPETTGKLTNLPAFVLEKSPYGAVFAEGPGVVIFDALFGPGPTMDSAPRADEDTEVPEREEATMDRLIAELDLKGKSREEVLEKLATHFSGFEYSMVIPNRPPGRRFDPQGDTALRRFLFQTKKGHCEFFATATVLVLHRLGIPARYAVGYVVHEQVSGKRKYVVRLRDAHAWCLVWDERRSMWRDFDPTPAVWINNAERPDWRQTLSDVWSRIKFEFLRIRWGQTKLRTYILWTVVPILVVLLAQIIFSRRKRSRNRKTAGRVDSWPGRDSELYELEKRMTRRGFTRKPGEPVSVWLERSARPGEVLSGAESACQELLKLHYRYRFDPAGLHDEDREALKRRARDLIAKLEH